jgi:hypothetical protein
MAAGCGKANTSDPAQQAGAFQSAGPRLQASWQLALDAAATNGYATAILTLRQLQAQTDLTPEQRAAVSNQMVAVNIQLQAALQKGDPDATKAQEELRNRWRAR